jgi:hypothetical protein
MFYQGDAVPKYRRKPEVREATQWFPGVDVPGVFREDFNASTYDPGFYESRWYVLTTHGQRAYLAPGDYVR